jgi:polar amino acid transport system substrate-binding protein
VQGDTVVLYTYAARDVAALCRSSSRLQRTRSVVAASSQISYTVAQSRAGAGVYRRYCLQCHGADLQGTAGPSVAGVDFLATARRNAWSLSDLRTTVVENMPFSNPGSLTPKQYADVMAFLLASNCYPIGVKPFPSTASPSFAKVKLAAMPRTKPANAKLGTCPVK